MFLKIVSSVEEIIRQAEMIDNTSRHYDALKTRLEAIIGIVEDHIDLSCSNTSPFLCLHQKCCLALQRLIISDSDCSIPPVNIPQTVWITRKT